MAAPIPPERDVKALLIKHAGAIAKLRNSVADVLKDADTELYDDVFLLRFCMSAADAAHAEEALRKTLAWRTEKAALLAGARPGAVPPPNYETLCKFVAAGMHGRTKEGDYLFIIRAGLANGKAMLEALGHDTVVELMLFNRERLFWVMNEETHKTGRLTKAVTVTDLNFSSISKMNRAFTQVLAKASELSEIYYPQYLDTAVMINVPSVMQALLRAVWSLFPKKMQQKLRVCPGKTLSQDISKCPFASSRLVLDSIPTFLGGTCHCPKGCIAGLANDQRECNPGVDAETGLSKWSVPAKGTYEVFEQVEAGQTVAYSVQVDKGRMTSGPLTMQAVLRTSAGKERVLLAGQSVSPDQGLLEGNFLCSEAGIVVFSWSNSASMFSRVMRYFVGVDVSAQLEARAGE